MGDRPVSVIIPTYNRAEKLTASVDSVLRQTHSALEVIVVDDGSTDHTEEAVAAITERDNRVRYYRMPENGGVSRARNAGVAEAGYDLIAFNDSDDLWHPEKLEKQLAYLDAHPEDVLVYCAYKVDIPGGGIIRIPTAEEERDTLEGEIFYYLLLRPAIGTPTILMRRDLFLQSGGFDPSYPVMEDWEFTIRISRTGPVGFVDEILLTVEATAADRKSCVSDRKTQLAHYEARCMLLAKYLDEIKEIGQFDLYAGEILHKAERDGLTDIVKGMMMEQLARRTIGNA